VEVAEEGRKDFYSGLKVSRAPAYNGGGGAEEN